MHSYISYNKLASLYICFAMLHTTLHNETDIIHRRYQNQSIKDDLNTQNTTEETAAYPAEHDQLYFNTNGSESKIFDVIIPSPNGKILQWHKTANYVVSST